MARATTVASAVDAPLVRGEGTDEERATTSSRAFAHVVENLAPLPFIEAWPLALAFSALGAIVGLTVWLVAYRKPAEGASC